MRLALLSVFALCGCAPALTSALRPSVDARNTMLAAQMAEMQANARIAQDLAEKQCEPFLRREVSWDEERSVGAQLAVTFTAQAGRLYLDGITEKDPQKLLKDLADRKTISLPEGGKNAVTTRVAVVGRNLARYSGRPQLPWVFGVIENDTAQTFSTPGGFVFVTTGLLKKMTNEAQLAGVLAHEIAHVVQKDMLRKYLRARHQQCVAANYAATMLERNKEQNAAIAEVAKYARRFADDFDLGKEDSGFVAFLMDATLMMVNLGNDNAEEFETDKRALELVSFAGYDAVQYEQFLTRWAQNKHPASTDRAAKLEALRNGELNGFANGTAKPPLGDVFAPLSAP